MTPTLQLPLSHDSDSPKSRRVRVRSHRTEGFIRWPAPDVRAQSETRGVVVRCICGESSLVVRRDVDDLCTPHSGHCSLHTAHPPPAGHPAPGGAPRTAHTPHSPRARTQVSRTGTKNYSRVRARNRTEHRMHHSVSSHTCTASHFFSGSAVCREHDAVTSVACRARGHVRSRCYTASPPEQHRT
jgi:hypothetical protein